jgi:protein HIRA/HIR1
MVAIGGASFLMPNLPHRLMPSVLLDSPLAFIDSAGHSLLAITARGKLFVWLAYPFPTVPRVSDRYNRRDVRKRTAVFDPVSVSDLVCSRSPSTSTAIPPTIVSARCRPNGSPVIALSNGTVHSFDFQLRSWTTISSPWWSKGSECWEGRIRSKSVNPVREVVRSIEGSVNDVLVVGQNGTGQYPDGSEAAAAMITDGEEGAAAEGKPARARLEGEEVEKRGGGDDWRNALSLGHLETRMAAAIALDSPHEYKQFALQYAKRLADEGFKGKAEEFVKELLGPVY